MGLTSDDKQVNHEEDGKHRKRGDFKKSSGVSAIIHYGTECRMTGRELFARLRHLPKFLFQVTDLVTQTSRKLELHVVRRRMHHARTVVE